MPVWGQYILGAGAIMTALSVLFTKVIKPLFRFAKSADDMMPLLRELTLAFRDTPGAFKVLDEIVAQFRTDSGSSLRDVVNRLEKAADASRVAAQLTDLGQQVLSELAEQDRKRLEQLMLLLDRLTTKIDAGAVAAADAVDRSEADRAHVAEDLSERRQQQDSKPDAAT